MKYLIFYILLLFCCRPKDRMHPERVKIIQPEEKMLAEYIEGPGTVSWFEKAAVSSKISGRLGAVYKRPGERAETGEILAEIEKLPLEIEKRRIGAEIMQAEAALELSAARYKNACRQAEVALLALEKAKSVIREKELVFANISRILSNNTELFSAGGITREKLENLRTEYETSLISLEQARADYRMQSKGYSDEDLAAENIPVPQNQAEKHRLLVMINTCMEKAECEAAEANLKKSRMLHEANALLLDECTIRAPRPGIIAMRNAENGEEARPEQTLFVIIDQTRVHISLPVNENKISFLRRGAMAEFESSAYPGKKFSGRVDLINPVADADSRSIECKVLYYDRAQLFRPGMYVSCRIYSGKKNKSLLIPAGCLIQKNTGQGDVFVVNGNTLVRRTVETGMRDHDYLEITGGLSSREEIAAEKTELLSDGMSFLREL